MPIFGTSPSTFWIKIIEPYYDKFKLQETCRECEKIFCLRPGITPERQERQNIVEVRQGVISFQSWIKDKLRDELINLMQHPGCGWQNVQELVGKYGLQIREHKTGLVFSHVSAKLFVKASSVERSFSKQSMESKLGKFEPASHTHTPVMTYQCPLSVGVTRPRNYTRGGNGSAIKPTRAMKQCN